jgi:hypothetical protein
MDAYEFETFIITKFGGVPQNKKGGDKGVDGKTKEGVPIQVKQQENVARAEIDKFVTAAKRYDARLFDQKVKAQEPVGYFIAFSYSKGSVEEISRLRLKENIIIELKKVSDIVPYDNPPKVLLSAEELEHAKYALEASAESKVGVDFYSWDFDHHPKTGFVPEVVLDTEGKQVHKFAPGKHQVAVKAVDKLGLEGVDTMKLKVKDENVS